jgi:hypothetical protein
MPLDSGLRLQILPDIFALQVCQKHQFAAFVRTHNILIVWDDDANHVLKRVQSIEDQLITMVWKDEMDDNESAPPAFSAASSSISLNADGSSLERGGEAAVSPRIVLLQPIPTAITIILLIAAIGSGWRQVALEIKVDHNWMHLAFIVEVSFQYWLALFLMQSVAGCCAQMISIR